MNNLLLTTACNGKLFIPTLLKTETLISVILTFMSVRKNREGFPEDRRLPMYLHEAH